MTSYQMTSVYYCAAIVQRYNHNTLLKQNKDSNYSPRKMSWSCSHC